MKRIYTIPIFISLLLVLFLSTNHIMADISVTVCLKAGDGITGLEGAKVRYAYGGSWLSFEDFTGASGCLSRNFPESYANVKVQISYNQGSRELIQNIQTNPSFNFQTGETYVQVLDHLGNGLPGVFIEQGGGYWQVHGYTGSDGKVMLQMFLPGIYKFRANNNNSSETLIQDMPILFQTGEAIRDNVYTGNIKASIGGGWRYFWPSPGSSVELFPGTYSFVYSPDPGNGTNESVTVIEGQTTIIPWGGQAAIPGAISGTVTVNGSGLEGVTVNLDGGVQSQTTGSNGGYTFADLSEGDHEVKIIEPLGYTSNPNSQTASVSGGQTTTVNFELTQQVILNNARSKGYWKHQFNVYVKNKGNAQESRENLDGYIAAVDQHYTPHFQIFAVPNNGDFVTLTAFEDWLDILSVKGNAGMLSKATEQLAALVLNFASLKIGQYHVVTADNRTAGDVLTYVSELLIDGDPTNDELAKDLAEMVNEQQTIDGNLVPPSSILYKNGFGSASIDWGFGVPDAFTLSQNFPNPFNPVTKITFAVKQADQTTLKVYNILGQEVATLFNGRAEPDRLYRFNFNGSDLASGVYIYRLQSGANVKTKMMMLTK